MTSLILAPPTTTTMTMTGMVMGTMISIMSQDVIPPIPHLHLNSNHTKPNDRMFLILIAILPISLLILGVILPLLYLHHRSNRFLDQSHPSHHFHHHYCRRCEIEFDNVKLPLASRSRFEFDD